MLVAIVMSLDSLRSISSAPMRWARFLRLSVVEVKWPAFSPG